MSAPDTVMTALVAMSGDPGALSVVEAPRPAPAAGEVLIAVRAAAVTPGELDWPESWPAIPGHDVSGTVIELGAGVEDVRVGDEVFALIGFDRPGAAAEYVCVPAADVARRPSSVDVVAAAALPLGALTAWQALFDHASLSPGQQVLVHGGAGGVGSYAVALAAHHGAVVAATASARDLDAVAQLGAATVVDYRTATLDDLRGRFDVVVDPVGGRTTDRSWALLRPGGILIGIAEEPDRGRAAAAGVRCTYFVVEPNRRQLEQLADLVDAAVVRPAVGRVVALADAADVFLPADAAEHRSGRTILEVDPTA